MTRDEIIGIAEQAGCGWTRNGTEPVLIGEKTISRFAERVAAAERERCAKVCDAYAMPDGTSETALALAAAIRSLK